MDFDLGKKECEIVGGVHDGLVCLVPYKQFRGTFQSMTWGRLVENPSFLLRVKDTDRFYGDFDVSIDHLDRVVSMEYDLSLGKQSEFLEKHEPEVTVYHIKPLEKDTNIIKKKIFYPYKKMVWKEMGEI